MKLLDHLFRLETISGDGICPTYLFRWTLLDGGKLFKLYLHHFIGNDWSKDLHDHPKRFVSIGLWGEYWEEVYLEEHRVGRGIATLRGTVHYRAPWFRSFPPEHRHRIRVEPLWFERPSFRYRGAWTLVLVGPTRREWGFWNEERWIAWKDYVWGGLGRQRKDC